ncbi:hypothetical protein J6590_094828 [Homalodisca vitripennis]|nr:hypothetical protein J6590_094828 [Homalodisca vitripennis]
MERHDQLKTACVNIREETKDWRAILTVRFHCSVSLSKTTPLAVVSQKLTGDKPLPHTPSKGEITLANLFRFSGNRIICHRRGRSRCFTDFRHISRVPRPQQ